MSIKNIFAFILFYGITADAQELVAHYKFDGTLLDETMNAYDLTTSSGFTPVYVTGKDGEANTAISGFGVSDFLSTTQNLSISGNDERTFSAWVKTGVDGSGSITSRGIMAHGENKMNAKFNLLICGEIKRSDPRPISFIGSSILNTGNWRHIVVTYKNNEATLYVNGKEEVVSTGSNDFGPSGINTTSSPLRIGNDYHFSGESGFEGAIDEVRIYDKGLTDEQVLNLYNGIALSLDDLNISKINVYPNPVKSIVNFDVIDVDLVLVFSIVGNKINVVKDVNKEINLESLSKGVYILKYYRNDKELLGISKIVKD